MIFVCCETENKLDLQHFNNSQKKTLIKLLNENDNILTKKYNSPVYDSYFKQLEELNNKNNSSEINNNYFNKKTSYCKSLSNLDIFNLNNEKYYDLNLKSEYLPYLKRVSNRNRTILRYYNSILSSGGISPVSTTTILNYFTKEDLKNDNIRLIINVHFLLINNPKVDKENKP